MSSSTRNTISKSPYERVMHDLEEQHPVEVMMAIRLPQTALKESIREAGDEIGDALGDKEALWLELESLLNQRQAEREEAHFDIGYEFGFAAGRAEALAQLSPSANDGTRELAELLRVTAKRSPLPAHATVAALLETAWAFIDQLATQPTDDE